MKKPGRKRSKVGSTEACLQSINIVSPFGQAHAAIHRNSTGACPVQQKLRQSQNVSAVHTLHHEVYDEGISNHAIRTQVTRRRTLRQVQRISQASQHGCKLPQHINANCKPCGMW
eukprot:4126045-Amphidinium_carterae.1